MQGKTITHNGKQLHLLITNKGTAKNTDNIYEVAVDIMGNNILLKNGEIVDKSFLYYKDIYNYVQKKEEIKWDYTVQ